MKEIIDFKIICEKVMKYVKIVKQNLLIFSRINFFILLQKKM